MKKLIIISSVSFLLIGFACVTYADVGVKKVPKMDNTLIVEDVSSLIVTDLVHYLPFNYELCGCVAILPEPIHSVSGTIEYLKNKKPIYSDPNVDRKWVWVYSVNYNV